MTWQRSPSYSSHGNRGRSRRLVGSEGTTTNQDTDDDTPEAPALFVPSLTMSPRNPHRRPMSVH